MRPSWPLCVLQTAELDQSTRRSSPESFPTVYNRQRLMTPPARLLLLFRPRLPTKTFPPPPTLGVIFATTTTCHTPKKIDTPSMHARPREGALTFAEPFDNNLTGAYRSPSKYYRRTYFITHRKCLPHFAGFTMLQRPAPPGGPESDLILRP